MKILRDESGEVMILAPSFGAQARPAASRSAGAAQAERVLRTALVVRAAKQHCRFFCQFCGSAILLPHDRIGMAFAGPNVRRIEARSVGSVCDSCKHVADFSLFRGSCGFDTRNALVTLQPEGETYLVDWLHCQEPTCLYRLPLFVTSHEPLTPESAREMARRWLWSELTCSSRHKISPPLWIFDRNPLHFPPAL